MMLAAVLRTSVAAGAWRAVARLFSPRRFRATRRMMARWCQSAMAAQRDNGEHDSCAGQWDRHGEPPDVQASRPGAAHTFADGFSRGRSQRTARATRSRGDGGGAWSAGCLRRPAIRQKHLSRMPGDSAA